LKKNTMTNHTEFETHIYMKNRKSHTIYFVSFLCEYNFL